MKEHVYKSKIYSADLMFFPVGYMEMELGITFFRKILDRTRSNTSDFDIMQSLSIWCKREIYVQFDLNYSSK